MCAEGAHAHLNWKEGMQEYQCAPPNLACMVSEMSLCSKILLKINSFDTGEKQKFNVHEDLKLT